MATFSTIMVHFYVRRLLLGVSLSLFAISGVFAQRAALKTNALYWGAYGSPNAALEVKLAPKWTLDLYAGGNLWKLGDNKTAKHLLAQPELRFWTCEAFNGFFIGLHAHGAKFNVGGLDIPVERLKALKDNRYEGYLYGGGMSVGGSWILSPRLNLETSIGGGYALIDYRKYPCANCGQLLDAGKYNYFGLTRATLSLVYFFK